MAFASLASVKDLVYHRLRVYAESDGVINIGLKLEKDGSVKVYIETTDTSMRSAIAKQAKYDRLFDDHNNYSVRVVTRGSYMKGLTDVALMAGRYWIK